MSPIEKQTLIILIQSVEQQLAGIKKILHATGSEAAPQKEAGRSLQAANYTTDAEDRLIAEALEFDKHHQVMHNIIKEAQNAEDQDGTERN